MFYVSDGDELCALYLLEFFYRYDMQKWDSGSNGVVNGRKLDMLVGRSRIIRTFIERPLP